MKEHRVDGLSDEDRNRLNLGRTSASSFRRAEREEVYDNFAEAHNRNFNTRITEGMRMMHASGDSND